MAEKICEGIWLLGRYSPFGVGVFILENGGEGALLEMPPYQMGAPKPWEDAKTLAEELNINIKWILLTHAHIDHTYGFPHFRHAFPKARVVAHRSFLEWYRRSAFDDIFYYDVKEMSLAGEPLFLLHAPKHSPQDLLIIYRGAVCTGDWTLGPVPEANPLVSPIEKLRTINRVREFLEKRDYYIHTAFSAHANEFRRNVDFPKLLDEMYDFWNKVPMHQWKRSLRQWQRNLVEAWEQEQAQTQKKGSRKGHP